ncbi:MAG: FAD-dependent monooxygenase, partial [Pseudonocardia sp.]|nr:FAD-dependent monooxygenase [Pseudonocardia sp.]
MATKTKTTDVLVAGAGPAGLMLAGDLAEAGVRVTVLERRAQESNVTRAFAVHARTLEELQIRGVASQLAATGTTIQALRLYGRASIDLRRLPSEFHWMLITPQFQTERVLAERVDRLGVSITHDAEVIGVAQDDAGVQVRTRGERSYRASYVVGADGVH